MARYPGATWRPIEAKYLPNKRITSHNRVNLHVAVTEASTLYHVFNKLGAVSSHFYVRRDGSAEQYVDTDFWAEADLEGNDATISIETQGGVNNADTEPWTEAQAETLAQIYAWAVRTHEVKLQIASTSQTNSTSHGLSWHRLGVDGNFPALPNPGAGRKQRGGGMHWSKSYGKLCPGLGKIHQVPGIFARAQQILNPSPAPAPAPVPALPEEDEMIVVINKDTNAAIVVSGGKSAAVVGWDQYVALSQTLPTVGVSGAQFAAFVEAFPLPA